jgi:hypothetical protein
LILLKKSDYPPNIDFYRRYIVVADSPKPLLSKEKIIQFITPITSNEALGWIGASYSFLKFWLSQ